MVLTYSSNIIYSLTHPYYMKNVHDWNKYRLTYEGGKQFVDNYLERLSAREDNFDFELRKKISYSPSFAKTGINEIKNSISARLGDVSRVGGSANYQSAIQGLKGGVDLCSSSMNHFMGECVLPELLIMGRVGVYVDMPPLEGPTLIENQNLRPYLYYYEAEDIRNWVLFNDKTFKSLLLRDLVYVYDSKTGMPRDEVLRYRYLFFDEEGSVNFTYYDEGGNPIDFEGNKTQEYQIKLALTKIPFVIFQLSDSLMKDICDYQISFLNLSSADLSYILKSNYPFYTEQYDPRVASQFLKRLPGTEESGNGEADPEKDPVIGKGEGRRYSVNTERPDFINPSSDPVKISMEKQTQLREEIRLLLHLALSNLKSTISSAEAKGFDERSIESGLSAIGVTLQQGERLIAEYWSNYESTKIPYINYPEKFDLQDDNAKVEKSNNLLKLLPQINSLTFKKEIAKRAARIVFNSKIPAATLSSIDKEIDALVSMDDNSEHITKDLENGLVDKETASKIRGYPKGVVTIAEKEQKERLQLIAETQTPNKGLNPANDPASLDNPGARGLPDADPTPDKNAKKDKPPALRAKGE